MMFLSGGTNFADIHCHIVPYVDDGAEDYEEAQKIITEEYIQGVRLIVMTVHLRYGMFDISAEKAKTYYLKLKKWLRSTKMKDLDIIFSREYYCDERFEMLLDGYINKSDYITFDGKTYSPVDEIIPFGKFNSILMEFSTNRMQEEEYFSFAWKALKAGLTPIIAHVERYPAVQKKPDLIRELRDYGAYIQVNSTSLISKGKNAEGNIANILVENNLVDFVSSDAHDMVKRLPNLKKCYGILKKNYGKNTAEMLLYNNAIYIVYGIEF